KLISPTQEQAVMDHIHASGATVPEALIDLAIFHHHDLTEQLSQIFGLPETDLTRFDYAPLCQQLGLRELITRYQALPLHSNGQILTLAVADPTHLQVEDEFRFATGLQVELVLADHKALHAAIRRLYGRSLATPGTQGKEISQD
ncbi:type IV-A pilus assembly ATPase PilB, partial [Vibrio parahaemolyticus]|nr:type IV-A pilus assembly ATPase PilB [Vibrio parahaemolyticus]